ncbi:hypothetical protein ENH_00079670 [Eimeria necatrix]|uniref:Uncharacterized protein n=1 Tax=Eimeria necatrix TaxID=51315 RepID=U6N6A0_9EIME|nr:hypothetical protein ENH_00079670 [Eimeria necatrix]CDJ70215.1 hypothetical protein ENH_00079670 [Eimeria necatrix]
MHTGLCLIRKQAAAGAPLLLQQGAPQVLHRGPLFRLLPQFGSNSCFGDVQRFFGGGAAAAEASKAAAVAAAAAAAAPTAAAVAAGAAAPAAAAGVAAAAAPAAAAGVAAAAAPAAAAGVAAAAAAAAAAPAAADANTADARNVAAASRDSSSSQQDSSSSTESSSSSSSDSSSKGASSPEQVGSSSSTPGGSSEGRKIEDGSSSGSDSSSSSSSNGSSSSSSSSSSSWWPVRLTWTSGLAAVFGASFSAWFLYEVVESDFNVAKAEWRMSRKVRKLFVGEDPLPRAAVASKYKTALSQEAADELALYFIQLDIDKPNGVRRSDALGLVASLGFDPKNKICGNFVRSGKGRPIVSCS